MLNSQDSRYRPTTANTAFKVHDGLLLITVPPPPPGLQDEGVKWWNYYCGLLVEGSCLSRTFLTAIHNLCIAHQARWWLEQVINKQGYVIAKEVTGRDGTVTVTTIANPLWHDLEDLLVKMSKLLSDMGMTPYSAKVTSLDFKGNLSPGNSTAASGPPKVNLPVPSLT